MIGIRNADGTLSWLMSPQAGSKKTVSLSPVRHGQKKVRLQLYLRNNQDEEKLIGILQFPMSLDGFLERPEMETQLRIDARGRLYVAIDVQGKTVQKRFTLPGIKIAKNQAIPAPLNTKVSRPASKGEPQSSGKQQPVPRSQNPAMASWMSLVPTILLFLTGTVTFALSIWLMLGGRF